MEDYTDLRYDVVREWICGRREVGKTWEELFLACKPNEERLLYFLESRVEDDGWPKMTIDDWQNIVNLQRVAEENTIRRAIEGGAAVIHGDNQINAVTISRTKNSSWQSYKRGLLEKGFKEETVNEIERATLAILRRLSLDTTETGPIKGLVVGNVQSGKTANMAALMAMAADCGWNMFIIFSGTIENLRYQTERRLFNDLHRNDCKFEWNVIVNPRANVPPHERSSARNFQEQSMHRYFTVSLKNASRIKGLLDWLQADVNTQSQMKVLVIDDEADQAGINTGDVNNDADRKTINRLIRNLINGKDKVGHETNGRFKAMNYIGYTATPYANVLNESERESLYPKDFIATLSVSKEYFGPQQIFGCEDTNYEGLEILRNIPNQELEQIVELHNDSNVLLPQSLLDAICWFLCGVACMRYWGYRKPITMLVHTSQKIGHHENVASAIDRWIKNTKINDLMELCRSLWERETASFTIIDFLEQYSDYGIDAAEINNYPSFEDIKENLSTLLDDNDINPRISNIPLADNRTPRYHNGIHLCVDNCANNGIANDMIVRLMYPEEERDWAPAFLVVGGATLSRGLTIEGLISTYFLRSVKQSDTLMQMGRWFGYRKGYELIPRIWLSHNTERQFQFLSYLDQRLREEIHYMETLGIRPSEYGPRVVNSPRLSWMRIVARNRMQMAQDTDRDYSGVASQTQLFNNDIRILSNNLNVTRNFLNSLGIPETRSPKNKHAENYIIWRNISFENVSDFLRNYSFQERQVAFSNLDSMIQWIQEMTDEDKLLNWNVILVGVGSNDANTWELNEHITIRKVSRSQKTNNRVEGVLNIGALRGPKDIVSDIDLTQVNDLSEFEDLSKPKYAFELREKAGLGKTPQLLIYIIDKDSQPIRVSTNRCQLNAVEDVVGLSITIPGENRYQNNVATVSVLINDLGVNNTNVDIDDAD
jgi:hypothetical protein